MVHTVSGEGNSVQSDPFRIRAHVPEFDDIVRDIVARSEATRATLPMVAHIPYGTGPAETLDLFFPDRPRSGLPVHMFIHGGYWRMFSKRDYSYVADTITAAGAIAVIVDYTLMPKVRMATLVDEVRRAKHWVVRNIAEFGGDASRLTVSGHSAGAHLSTFLFNETETPSGLNGALLLGGLYDLKPLQSSFLETEIGITDEEVMKFSPMDHIHDPDVAVDLVVGADETKPFHEQAEAFAARLQAQGLKFSRSVLPGENHMSSVRAFGVPTSAIGQRLMELISRS
jgi:arylformamidase